MDQRAWSDRSREYLRTLPQTLSLLIEDKKVLLFHASPHKNNLYWYEDRPEKFFHEMAEKMDGDIYIYGHTHKPYRKDLNGKVFINAGSVGKPKDGDPRACVAVVEVTQQGIKSEFLRVSYNVERIAAEIIASGLPAPFAEGLKRGR